MYRAVTLYLLKNEIDCADTGAVSDSLKKISIDFHLNAKTKACEAFLNQQNVEADIRQMRVSEKVSEVSAIKAVRVAMVRQQQQMGEHKGVVLDGRDIGSVVFPQAELKVFMTANVEVRAQRRQKELAEKGQTVDIETVKENLMSRDQKDSSRKESPLIQAADAVVIDTSNISFHEQVDEILALAKKRIGE